MFDPIQGPAHPGQGPSTGDSTENGDSYYTAVAKINAGFKRVIEAITGGAKAEIEAVDKAARDRVEFLESALSDLLFKVDSLEAKVSAMSTPPAVPPAGQAGLDAVAAALGGTAGEGAAG